MIFSCQYNIFFLFLFPVYAPQAFLKTLKNKKYREQNFKKQNLSFEIRRLKRIIYSEIDIDMA